MSSPALANQNSLENSSRDSSDDSSDASDASSNTSATVIGALLVGAGMVVLGIALTNNTAADDGTVARVDRFLKRYHPMIARDVVLAEGPTLRALSRDLGLSLQEQQRVRSALLGSAEQTELLEALAAPEGKRVARFSAGFRRLMVRALGAARLEQLHRDSLAAPGSSS